MVNTAVIAAAGRGTRMYPFSLTVPKELIPLGTVPVIQYVMEELFEAGITNIIVVFSEGKESIQAYLSVAMHRSVLAAYKDETVRLRMERFVENLSRTNITFLKQNLTDEVYGNGIPLKIAKSVLGQQPFIYTWADDFISTQPSRFSQLITAFDSLDHSVLSGVLASSREDYARYAYIESTFVDTDTHELIRIHEKPGHLATPSNIGVLSGHLFAPAILDFVDHAYAKHAGGEFLFNDVLHTAIEAGEKVYVKVLEGATFNDTGNAQSYSETFTRITGHDKL